MSRLGLFRHARVGRVIIYPLVAILLFLFLDHLDSRPVSPGNTSTSVNESPGTSANLSPVPRGVYFYRTISAMYDSVVVSCMYGEICLPNEDSLTIQYELWHSEPGLDTTAQALYNRSKTVPFPVTDTTQLVVWRGLAFQLLDYSKPHFIPDTCAWILELHDASNGDILAVLDSAGFIRERGADTTTFPTVFGTANQGGNSYDMLTYDMGDYCQGVDSVYLRFRIKVFGTNDDCNMYDSQSYMYKFSDSFSPSAKRNQDRAPNPSGISLRAFPNPARAQTRLMITLPQEQYIKVVIRSVDGRVVKEIESGLKSRGTHVLPFTPGRAVTGVYYAVVTDGEGDILKTEKFLMVQ